MEGKKIYQDIDEDSFENEVLKTKDVIYVVVFNNDDFVMNDIYDSIVKRVASDFVKVKFCRGSNADCEKVIKRLKIRKLPTLLMYKNGKVVGSLEGIIPRRDLRAYLDEVLQRELVAY